MKYAGAIREMKADEDFFEWFQTATEEEKALVSRAGEYEERYFEDMTLKPDSILHGFVAYEAQDDNGEWFETSDSINISIISYRFKISKMRSAVGLCNAKKRIIYIHPKHITDETVILHEMIHAYECILLQDNGISGQIFRDTLTLCLYNSLKPKINNLDTRILDHSHVFRQWRLNNTGGFHGILFFLKSLDLDIRLGLKLGTVCGYGREEFVSNTGEEI